MAKNNNILLDILDTLYELPWWVSVITAATVYTSLKYILPTIVFDSAVFSLFAQILINLAGLLAIVFLIPAPLSAINSWRKKKQLDNQEDLDSIRALSWKQFEELVAEAFRRRDYSVIENTSTGPDGGIDITLKQNSNEYIVQCKHWKKSKVGVNLVREMFGVMTAEHAQGVKIITSGFFTEAAKDFAKSKPIELIEGNQLLELVKNAQASRTEPPQEQDKISSLCPKCSNEMILRTAKQGKNIGKQFYGCSAFPKCRYTIDY